MYSTLPFKDSSHPSPQLWLCLAALCVLDEEQAEALSSGQWLGQDGKPKVKVSEHTAEPRERRWETVGGWVGLG